MYLVAECKEGLVILPTHLQPSIFGLTWGMSKDHCQDRLNTTPLRETQSYIVVEVKILGKSYQVGLQFDKNGGLWRVEVNLYTSRAFWENFTYDEMDSTTAEYQAYYNQLKEYCISVLGSPEFSGFWGTDGYPENQTANHITYWDQPEGRLQIEFEHPDKEYPMFVRVACYLAYR